MRIIQAAVFSGALFFGVFLCLWIGWRIGQARVRRDGEDSITGFGALEGAIYALMGLLIAFTFTGAAQRFDHRRELIVDEVNAIGTAWLRLDLLESNARGHVKELFKQYLDARIEAYAHIDDNSILAAAVNRSAELQRDIWDRLVAAIDLDPRPRTATVVLPPVNEMFDLANTRVLATQQHPPIAIYLMLGFLVLVSALLAGFGMAKAKRWSAIHVVGFAAIVSMAVYLILDLEFPRLGLLRVNDFDRAFLELRASMD
ncbi:hypothetical protein GCM10011487_27100 [Steroidobacter agaridevorans]|uniref:DUF4239 domain-containing protein n=1 Tax=Steroidobacter agaridevorans TaxID=2695856 RepID=A0A829YBQ7_9GAMM|nr:DUF4239 domain-containing protein [Steroidobacter agaridevorans]GFE80710.1 hypothetical protein GCM10011487_27100 [Steroidobacter agaridevorans]